MASNPISIGFPRMMKERGERRVFLPDFVQTLTKLGATVFIEDGYGSRSGFSFDDYQAGNPDVHRCSREEAFAQNLVLVLRSPTLDEYGLIRKGGCLMTMLHFPTRKQRVERLKGLKINAISLDSIVNDRNIRLVENMRSVAWNGLEIAFDVLEKRWPALTPDGARPLRVLILGTGMVGKHAVDAATKLGNVERNNDHISSGGPGVIATTVGRNVSHNPATMQALMKEADIFVDATQRSDTSKPVIPNEWLGWLPEHALVVDLAVDPYLPDAEPPVVRGIEGIPQGNLDQYVFAPDDPDWSKLIPPEIPTEKRRTSISCYSWPGIHPEACMLHYAQQLEPLMEVLLEKGYAGLSPEGSFFERALFRGTLKFWLQHSHYSRSPR